MFFFYDIQDVNVSPQVLYERGYTASNASYRAFLTSEDFNFPKWTVVSLHNSVAYNTTPYDDGFFL